MDKLNAYRILGLENNASTAEVKEAYARLSKEYHPEENPEEFQRIHEAYTTLTRRGRRASHTTMTEPVVVKETHSVVQEENDLVFHGIKNAEEEVEDDAVYDFDESIHQAKDDENKKLLQSVIQADKELKILFVSSNYKNPDKFKAFFARKEFSDAFYTREFINSLIQCLSKEKLKTESYSFLVEFYRLKENIFEDLIPEVQQLYQIIDSRYSIKKDTYKAQRPVNKYSIFAIVWFVVISNSKRFMNVFGSGEFETTELITCVIPYLFVFGVGMWLYKLYRREHSSYFSQALVAGIFTVISIVISLGCSYMVRYTEIFSSKLPLSIAILFFFVSVDWLLIVGIIAFLQKIRRRK